MKTPPLPPAAKAAELVEATPVVREMLQARTRELALKAGRPPPQVSQVDYERAKRELTGETDIDRQDAVLAAMQAEFAAAHPRRALGSGGPTSS